MYAETLFRDLRDRAVGAVEPGSLARSAARVFGVSGSTTVKWIQRWRRMGRLAAPDTPLLALK